MAEYGSGLQKPQLMYFNVPGRVAGLRILMFAIYGKDGWEDRRVEFQDWSAIKPTLPLQFLPVLTLPDGRRVHQAEAIMRWAGRQVPGLYPADDLDAALFVDEMMSTVYEALSKAPRPSSVVTAEMLPGLWKEFTEGPMRVYFDYIQKQLGPGPFFRSAASPGADEDNLCIADLALYMLVNYFANGEIPHVSTSYVEQWPGISAHFAAVKAHPMVTAYEAAYVGSGTGAIDKVAEFAKVDTSAISSEK